MGTNHPTDDFGTNQGPGEADKDISFLKKPLTWVLVIVFALLVGSIIWFGVLRNGGLFESEEGQNIPSITYEPVGRTNAPEGSLSDAERVAPPAPGITGEVVSINAEASTLLIQDSEGKRFTARATGETILSRGGELITLSEIIVGETASVVWDLDALSPLERQVLTDQAFDITNAHTFDAVAVYISESFEPSVGTDRLGL